MIWETSQPVLQSKRRNNNPRAPLETSDQFSKTGYIALGIKKQMPSVFVSTIPFGEHDRSPLNWLKDTGWSFQVNDTGRKLTSEEVAERAGHCDGIVAGTEDLRPLIDRNLKLKVIARVGVGLDSVPLRRCRDRGIAVSYTPDAVTPAVAEFTIGVMVAACRSIAGVDRKLRSGKWHREQGKRIGNSRIGIIGFGRIGSYVGRLVAAFNPAAILVCDIADKSKEIADLSSRGAPVEAANLDRVLEECDIVTLHVPIDRFSRGFISEGRLRQMGKGSYLINASRGGLVDEAALYRALKDGHLAGAAIDVFEHEPYRGPLLELENILVTPHLGSCSVDCRANMEREATEDLIRFLTGKPLQSPVPLEEYENQI